MQTPPRIDLLDIVVIIRRMPGNTSDDDTDELDGELPAGAQTVTSEIFALGRESLKSDVVVFIFVFVFVFVFVHSLAPTGAIDGARFFPLPPARPKIFWSFTSPGAGLLSSSCQLIARCETSSSSQKESPSSPFAAENQSCGQPSRPAAHRDRCKTPIDCRGWPTGSGEAGAVRVSPFECRNNQTTR
jgi:hypothetical protein